MEKTLTAIKNFIAVKNNVSFIVSINVHIASELLNIYINVMLCNSLA